MASGMIQERFSEEGMSTNNLDFEEVEVFLNAHPNFLGTFLAKNDLTKHVRQQVSDMTKPPTLSLTMPKCVEKVVNHRRVQKKQIVDATMDENQRFGEFVKDIAGELNVNALSHKILQNVVCLTGSDRGRLFLVEGTDEKYLVSKLVDVTATSQLGDTMHDDKSAIRIPFGEGIIGMVAESKVPMNIKDAKNDHRYNPTIDTLAGYQTRCILCMPILRKNDEVLGVAEIMNKKGLDCFSEKDEILFSDYLRFCGIGINNARLFQLSIEEIKRNQLLLTLAWRISTGENNIGQIIQIILEHALTIFKCKFASVYLIDEKRQSFDKIYRLSDPSTTVQVTNEETDKNVYTDMAKKCLQSNEIIFFRNLSEDPEFVACADISSEQDSAGDSENIKKIYEEGANCILCTAVTDPSNKCIGCIMFAGKIKVITNKADANTIEAFAVYCGLGIYNCQLYQRTVKSLTTKQVLMEILSYHMTSEKGEVERFVNKDMPSVNECKIYDFGFNDSVLSDVSTVQACALMFIKLNALNILGISLEHLYHWILTVKKNYRPLLYHNWRHALNVSQTMFCALSKGVLKKYFSPFECICLLIASLCHDLDYEGYIYTNQKDTSLLASVYSTCSSEHQVLGRCVMILNAEATNIFRNLTAEKYREGMELIKKAIFATDVYVYLVNEKHFGELKKKRAPFQNDHDKDMLTVLTMFTCDLTAFSKPWNNHKSIVLGATLDLFQQPESEREAPVLKKSESYKIPSLIIEFIDIICLKAFQTMAEFDESFLGLHDACIENRKHWDAIVQRIDDFDFETELNKSRAGLVDFELTTVPIITKATEEGVVKEKEEREKAGSDGEREKKEPEIKAKEEKGMKEEEEKGEKEKEMEELEQRKRVEGGKEKEKEAKEAKEKEVKEKEMREREVKEKKEKEAKERVEREEREKKEKEEKEKKEKEERERVEREENEKKEKEEKEMLEREEKEKKEKEEEKRKAQDEKKEKEKDTEKGERKGAVKQQLMTRMSDKLIILKPPSDVPTAEESRSTISPSPTVSPQPKLRKRSKESEFVSLSKRLSYRQPEENGETPQQPRQRGAQGQRRKSCIEEIAAENLKHRNDKANRKPSTPKPYSPAESLQSQPGKEKPKRKKSALHQALVSEPTPEEKKAIIVRSEPAKQRIKANAIPTGEKRKCTPRQPDRDARKKIQKSSSCSII